MHIIDFYQSIICIKMPLVSVLCGFVGTNRNMQVYYLVEVTALFFSADCIANITVINEAINKKSLTQKLFFFNNKAYELCIAFEQFLMFLLCMYVYVYYYIYYYITIGLLLYYYCLFVEGGEHFICF